MVFGDNQSPVNFPINALSSSKRSTWIVSSCGRATTGTSSIHLMNFRGDPLEVFLLCLTTSFSNTYKKGALGGPPSSAPIGQRSPFTKSGSRSTPKPIHILHADHRCTDQLLSEQRMPSRGACEPENVAACRSNSQRNLLLHRSRSCRACTMV